MELVIYTIFSFIVIGGVGMYLGNRKVDRPVSRQRWLKYWAFIFITSFIVCSIWFHFFLPVVIVVILAGYFELVRTIRLTRYAWLAIAAYSIVAAGLLFCGVSFRRELQFFVYLQILAFDAFSQVVGQLIGKTVIATKVSPSKTVEGLLGGIVFGVLASLLMSSWIHITIAQAVIFGLFTALTGFAGDMLASFYKRVAGIKDYSNLLPGQGGFLDRFDGFMMASFCYCLVHLLRPGWLP
jgi:phosphatidate cytidylyltransferase